MLDVRIWILVLFVQSVPYASAVLVSLISAMPSLPASLIGHMPEMRTNGVLYGDGVQGQPERRP